MWCVAFASITSCASTVTGGAADAADPAPTDAAVMDFVTVDVGVPDVGRDVARETRVCPRPVVDDVPTADVAAPDGPYVVDLAVESQLHHCARMSDGTLRCRGLNQSGQLGLGTSVGPRWGGPVEVPGLRDVEQVVTTDTYVTCTRHRDGTVRCWGSNRYDMLGTGHEGDERCASGDPCRRSPTLVPGLVDVVFIAVNDFAVCAVSRDGSVRCWGNGDPLLPRGAAATPTLVTPLTDVATLRPYDLGWLARRRSGEYVTHGVTLPDAAGIEIPPEAEFVHSDTTFASHLCYRLPDATARCFGANWFGKIGNGGSAPGREPVTEPRDPGLCGVRSVVTGTYNSCALLTDRTVECWGEGTHNALGREPPDRCVGLSNSGDVPCATHPAPVPGLDRVDQIFVGVWGGCALRLDHSVWCWGTLAPDITTGSLGPIEW